MPPLSTSHKRGLSGGEVPNRKRLNQDVPSGAGAPNARNSTAAPRGPLWIYIAVRETRSPYEPHTHKVIEGYTTVHDANKGLKALRRTDRLVNDRDWEPWKEKYDTNGCLTLSTDAGEGDEIELRVQRIPVRAAVSVPQPPETVESEGDE